MGLGLVCCQTYSLLVTGLSSKLLHVSVTYMTLLHTNVAVSSGRTLGTQGAWRGVSSFCGAECGRILGCSTDPWESCPGGRALIESGGSQRAERVRLSRTICRCGGTYLLAPARVCGERLSVPPWEIEQKSGVDNVNIFHLGLARTPSYWPGFLMFLPLPSVHAGRNPVRVHLGHGIAPRQRGFCFLRVYKA